ncbi:hypothetical protein Tco_1463827, partial [Tanacetum coccineum]
VKDASDSSAPVTHAVQSPPETSPLTADDMPVDQLMEKFDMVTAQQAALVAQLRARFASERSQSVQKDEKMLLLKTQLAVAQAEAESSRSYAQKLAEEKMALLVKVAHKPWSAPCCHEYFGIAGGQAVLWGCCEAMEELHEKKLLTVPAAQVPGYTHNAYEELVAAIGGAETLSCSYRTAGLL